MKRKDVPCPSLQVCTLQPDQYMKKVPEEEFRPPVDEYSQHTCILSEKKKLGNHKKEKRTKEEKKK